MNQRFHPSDLPPAVGENLLGDIEVMVENMKRKESIPRINIPHGTLEENVREALESTCSGLGVEFRRDVTASNSGFFAGQGMSVSKVPATVPDIDVHLGRHGDGGRLSASPDVSSRPQSRICVSCYRHREGVPTAGKVALLALRRLRGWT